MTLHEMSAHASGCTDSALEIDSVVILQCAEIGATECFGGYTDGELGGCEGCDSEASTIDADAVAFVGVGEGRSAVCDNRGLATLGVGVEGGDLYM